MKCVGIVGTGKRKIQKAINRIRERTLRTETLDRSNAKDLEQVVRILREVDVSPVSSSSTLKKVIYKAKELLWSCYYGRNGRIPA